MDNLRKIEFVLVVLVFCVVMFLVLDNYTNLSGFIVNSYSEVNAPYNFILEEDIEVYPDKIILNIDNYTLSRYSFSGSMVPVFDSSANGVGIKPNSEEDLHVGDIITFRYKDDLVVHRIIKKGIDEEGWFFITKGDNNNFSDGKIRFQDIDSVLVVLIY